MNTDLAQLPQNIYNSISNNKRLKRILQHPHVVKLAAVVALVAGYLLAPGITVSAVGLVGGYFIGHACLEIKGLESFWLKDLCVYLTAEQEELLIVGVVCTLLVATTILVYGLALGLMTGFVKGYGTGSGDSAKFNTIKI